MSAEFSRLSVRWFLVILTLSTFAGVVLLSQVIVVGDTFTTLLPMHHGRNPNTQSATEYSGYPLPWSEWHHVWSEATARNEYEPRGQNWFLFFSAILVAIVGPTVVFSFVPSYRTALPEGIETPCRMLLLVGIGGLIAATLVIALLFDISLFRLTSHTGTDHSQVTMRQFHAYLRTHNISFSWPLYTWVTCAGNIVAVAWIVVRRRRRKNQQLLN